MLHAKIQDHRTSGSGKEKNISMFYSAIFPTFISSPETKAHMASL